MKQGRYHKQKKVEKEGRNFEILWAFLLFKMPTKESTLQDLPERDQIFHQHPWSAERQLPS
jgi:hypothetical protein